MLNFYIHAALAIDNSSVCETQLLTNSEWNTPVLVDSWVRQ